MEFFMFACRRAQSYLKFLGSDSSFRLNNEPNIYVDSKCQHSILPYSIPLESLNISPVLKKSLMRDKIPECRHMTRHLSQTDFLRESPKGNIHHSSSLQTLLKQEDMRGTSRGLTRKLKNFKTSSQNIFSKKMIALKSKLSDTGMIDEGVKPNERSNKKKRGLFKRTVSDSNAMAEILVRSAIHAHNSLDCILETHDNVPKPILVKQQSLMDEQSDETCMDYKDITEIDSYLSLPDVNLDGHSTTSCESSSDEEEEEEDLFDIKDNDVVLDTVSDIVKNVEIIQRRLSLQAHESDNNNPNNLILDDESNFNSNPSTENIGSIDEPSISIEDINVKDDSVNEQFNDLLETNEINPLTETVPNENTFNNGVIPVVQNNNNNKPIGLFQTAMQTMLLEKVNLIGTPPISPTCDESFTYNETNSKQFEDDTDHQVIPIKMPYRRSQSPTSLSLMEYDTRETVLGAPFKSVHMVEGKEKTNIQRTASLDELNQVKKRRHFHISFKPFHEFLKHKHKDSHKNEEHTGSMKNIHERESIRHRLSHAIKHKRTSSPSSRSLVDHKELKDNVFKHFATFSRKLKHRKHKRSKSPGTLSLTEFLPTELTEVNKDNKKMTSFSLADLREKDSVLGGPFQSIFKKPKPLADTNVKSDIESNTVVKDSSDTNIKEDIARVEEKEDVENSKSTETKELFRPRTLSNPVTFNRVTSERRHDNKRESITVPKRTRTYSDSAKKDKKHEWEFSSIKHKLSGSLKHKPKQKSQGLLKTALQTVLMESVNDILATSHSDSKEKLDNLKKVDNNDELPSITSVPNVKPDKPVMKPMLLSSKQADVLPVNTKIDGDNSNNNINTLHARLTPSLRNVGSPQPELLHRQETGHHRTESVGAKMSHSPAKVSIVPSMHRRSSDSDLSITPKGTTD